MDSYLRIFGRGFLVGRRDAKDSGSYYSISYMGGTFEFKDNRDLSSLMGRFIQFSVLAAPRAEARSFNGQSFVVTSFVPVVGAPVEIEECK